MTQDPGSPPAPDDTLPPAECLQAWAIAVAAYTGGRVLEASVGPEVGGWPVLCLSSALGKGSGEEEVWQHFGFGVRPWGRPLTSQDPQADPNEPSSPAEVTELYLSTRGNEAAVTEAFTILIESLQATADSQPAVPGLMLYHPGSIAGAEGPNAWVIGWDLTPIILPVPDLGLWIRYLPVYPIYRAEIPILEKVGMSRFLGRIGPAINDLGRPALSDDSPGGPDA